MPPRHPAQEVENPQILRTRHRVVEERKGKMDDDRRPIRPLRLLLSKKKGQNNFSKPKLVKFYLAAHLAQ
jgi:hypothetical protein